MAYAYVANAEIGMVCDSISFYVDRLTESRVIDVLKEAAETLEADTGEHPDPKVVKNWRKRRQVNLPEFFLGVAENLRHQMLADVLMRCQEMRAAELAWEQLAEAFDGQSPLAPELRGAADETRGKLRSLVDRLNGPRRLPEPGTEAKEAILARVEHAFRQIGVVETSPATRTEVPRFRDASRWQRS